VTRHAAAGLALALAGCALAPPAPSPVAAPAPAATRPPEPLAAESAQLVAYLARVRRLEPDALAAETERQRRSVRDTRSRPLEAVKLALALCLAPAPDDIELVALLEPVAREPATDEGTRAMAGFLLQQASERRRLKEAMAAAGSRLRDERRAREAARQRAEALQERAAQLQQKIDALSELEKSLSDRPTRLR